MPSFPKITKVVIPIAGMGTRFLPITKSVPKEMLPIIDTPVIQYLVEEAEKCGITDIILVNSPGKTITDDYFTFSPKFDSHLRKQKKSALADDLKKLDKKAKFRTVIQKMPLGDGHAILQAKNLIKNEPFAVLFGDDIWDSKIPPLKQLIRVYEQTGAPVVSLEKIPKSETHKYGIIEIAKQKNKTFEIKNFIEKPSPSKAPSTLALTGKYVITPKLLKALSKAESSQDKELRLIDGMRDFIKNSPIYGQEISGHRFDTGDKLGYLKATVHFALKNKDLNREFKKYLKGLF